MSEVKRHGGRIWIVHPMQGKHHSEETRLKLKLANVGKKASPETKLKMSLSRKGKKGTMSFEGRRRMIESRLNEKNPMWKGKIVGKDSLHEWIRRRKTKPEFCEECGKNPPKDLANISQEYKRDVNDFRWLCRRCHITGDGRIFKNLNQYKTIEVENAIM